MRTFALLLVLGLLLGACQEPDMVRSPGSVAETPSPKSERSTKKAGSDKGGDPSPAPVEEEEPALAVPAPDSPLPRAPKEAAAALREAHESLDTLVEKWTAAGAEPGDPLESEIELWGLYQQRLYRSLSKGPGDARRVLSMLPGAIRSAASANLTAQRDLYRLNQPVEPPIKLPRTKPEPARDLLRYFKRADRRFGVPWYVLASVNFIETRFGRLKGPSSAGALGPMQFLPSTWDQYGAGGDIMDPADAITGAARYLSASGAPGDVRGALFAYNRSDLYVNAILAYAKQMKKDPRDFYAYYHWQVFVRTTKGDVQLTGPGRD